jgi:hypothetical protein
MVRIFFRDRRKVDLPRVATAPAEAFEDRMADYDGDHRPCGPLLGGELTGYAVDVPDRSEPGSGPVE